MSFRILSTKKLTLSQRQHLLMSGFHVVEADFISTNLLNTFIPALEECIIVTSQNAVGYLIDKVGQKLLQSKKFFCVGEKTAQMLSDLGMEVSLWKPYAEALAEALLADFADKRFTFVSGTLRRNTLPDSLQKHGVYFEEWQVYETQLTPLKVEGVFHGVLFFSPSGVDSFLQLNTFENTVCFAIGNTTYEALKPFASKIIVANRPTVENTLITCIKYFNKFRETSS